MFPIVSSPWVQSVETQQGDVTQQPGKNTEGDASRRTSTHSHLQCILKQNKVNDSVARRQVLEETAPRSIIWSNFFHFNWWSRSTNNNNKPFNIIVWLQLGLRTFASLNAHKARCVVLNDGPLLTERSIRDSPSLRFPPWSPVHPGWSLSFPTSPYLRWHGAVKWSEGSNNLPTVKCRLSSLEKNEPRYIRLELLLQSKCKYVSIRASSTRPG